MAIFDKSRMENRTWIEQVKALFNMGKELEQNSVTTDYVDEKIDTEVSTVGKTGEYDDLKNKPSIPSVDNLQTKLTPANAGANINITGSGDNLKISASGEITQGVEWGAITGTISNQGDLTDLLDDKQDVISSGEAIEITDNVVDVIYDGETIGVSDDNELYVNIDGLQFASASTKGIISSADWNIFNSKQPAGDYATNSNLNKKQKKVYYGIEDPDDVVDEPEEYDIYIKITE